MKKRVDPFYETISSRKAVLIGLVFLGYVLLFFPLFAFADRQAVVFYLFPTIIIALKYGRWWGLAAGLLYAPINRFLFTLVNASLIDYQGSRSFWFTYLIFPIIGFLLGYLREEKIQLEEKQTQEQAGEEERDQREERPIYRETVEVASQQDESMYKHIVESAIGAVQIMDLDGKISYVNERTVDMHGFSREELIGQSVQFLTAEGEQDNTEEMFKLILAGKTSPVLYERMVRHKDGSVFPVEVTISLVTNTTGEPLYIQSIAREITARKLVEEALKASEASLKKSQQLAHVGNWEWHLDDNAFWISEEFCRIYGLLENDRFHEVHSFLQKTTLPDDLDKVRRAMRYFRSGQHPEQGIAYRIERPDGEIRWVKISAAETKSVDVDGRPTILIGMVQDVTEQVKVEENLQHLATHDSLTELPNRALFYDRLNHAIVRAKRDQTSLAILFIDIDGFKIVNDTYGHLAGDKLLKDVAERLQSCVRGSDTVARMGGDEFTVILENVEKRENTETAINSIISALSEPYRVDGRKTTISACIGVALFPDDAEQAHEVLQKADQAMYAAKNDPDKKKWYRFYQDFK
jgi:diguanylate cyclase (GGDEF)-like protein/PAS domain S-box-containing protein